MGYRRQETEAKQFMDSLRDKRPLRETIKPEAYTKLTEVTVREFKPADMIVFMRVALTKALKNINGWLELDGKVQVQKEDKNLLSAIMEYYIVKVGATEVPESPRREVVQLMMESVAQALDSIFTNFENAELRQNLQITKEDVEIIERIKQKIELHALVGSFVYGKREENSSSNAQFFLELRVTEQGEAVISMSTIGRVTQAEARSKFPSNEWFTNLGSDETKYQLFAYLCFSKLITSLIKNLQAQPSLADMEDNKLLKDTVPVLHKVGVSNVPKVLSLEEVEAIAVALGKKIQSVLQSFDDDSTAEGLDITHEDFEHLLYLKSSGVLEGLWSSIAFVSEESGIGNVPEKAALVIEVRNREEKGYSLFIRGVNKKRQYKPEVKRKKP